MQDQTAKTYFPKHNYYWSIEDELDHQETYQEPSGPWYTQGDGCVYSIQEIEAAKLPASGIDWSDEESSDFYPSKVAHLKFTKAERSKQDANYQTVITYIFKVKDNKDQLRKVWKRVADRYSQEKTNWLSPWGYAIINNTIRRFLSE